MGGLFDKSAAARADDPLIGTQLAELAGSLFVCPVGELEQHPNQLMSHEQASA